MCWFFPRPALGTVRTSILALETSAGSLSGMLAQHAILPWTVATTVNRGRCLDTCEPCFDVLGDVVVRVLDITSERSLCWWLRFRLLSSRGPGVLLSSYASRSMLEFTLLELALP